MVKKRYKRKNRRVAKRRKKTNKENKVKFVGINSAGLNSKIHSFDKMLSDLQPEMFFIEETKLRRNGTIKTKNSHKYQIFELFRKNYDTVAVLRNLHIYTLC